MMALAGKIDFEQSQLSESFIDIFKPEDNLGPKVRLRGFH